jgi:hypothetical protein
VDTTPASDPGEADAASPGGATPEATGDQVEFGVEVEVEVGVGVEVGVDTGSAFGHDDVDRQDDGDEDPDRHDPLRFNRWMRSSTTGAVLSGIALGLQQALEPTRQLPAFVMEAPGEPEDPDAPIVLHFDPDDPTKTVAVIRAPAADPGSPPAVPPDANDGVGRTDA